MITVEHLTRNFSEKNLMLQDLNFHIEKGSSVGLIGPNGSGKRSLMKLILGIYNPSQGRIWVMGKTPSLICQTPLRMTRADRKRMAFILSEVISDARVAEVVSKKKRDDPNEEAFLSKCFEVLRISELLASKLYQLSRGELARVRFYEAISSMPDLLLLYEPFAGVDAITKERMIHILKSINREYSVTILLAVQNLNDMEALCTRTIVLDKGKCIYTGEISSLRRRYLLSNRLIIKIASGTPDLQDLPIQRFSLNNDELEITFDSNLVHAADIIDHVMQTCSAYEILIHEPLVEDLFRGLYSSKGEDE